MTAKAFEHPAGRWAVGIIAVVVFISGFYQVYKGATKKFMKRISLIGSGYTEFFKKAGMIGYISRGVVLAIIGYFIFRAAINLDPQSIQSTDGVFGFLRNRFGVLLMFVVAVGLIGYGVFMFVKARHEKFSFE